MRRFRHKEKKTVQSPGGKLFDLPAELRIQIYQHLLTPSEMWASGEERSPMTPALLRTCKAIHQEASEVLYSSFHRFSIAPHLPFGRLPHFPRLSFEFHYFTQNRGDCELLIDEADFQELRAQAENVGFWLRRSQVLKELRLVLLNGNQRKTGMKRLRTDVVVSQVRKVLEPFAYLSDGVKIDVCGFNTIDYVEMFHAMRVQYQGQSPPYQTMIEDVWNSSFNFKPRPPAQATWARRAFGHY